MSGQSSVGNRAIYEAGDQRNVPQSEINERQRYKEGEAGSHKNLDSKDQRSIANKLAAQEGKPDSSHHHNNEYNEEAELSKQDPTKPVSYTSSLVWKNISNISSYRPSSMETLPRRALRSTPSCRLRMSSACERRASRNKKFAMML